MYFDLTWHLATSELAVGSLVDIGLSLYTNHHAKLSTIESTASLEVAKSDLKLLLKNITNLNFNLEL